MTKTRRAAAARAALSSSVDPPQAAPSHPPTATADQLTWRGSQYDHLLLTLRQLATRDDGWLRLIPDTDRQQVHLKWKFTRGAWERHYVWVTIDDMRVHLGLSLLIRKLQEVDASERRPTLDKLYEEN